MTVSNELIEKCVKQDRASQKALYDILAPGMFTVCVRFMKDRDVAEDVFQESFVMLFKRIHQFRFEGSFEGWARQIFARRCIEQLRKNKSKHSFEYNYKEFDEIPIESSSPNMLDILKENDILRLIDGLSYGYRTVFRLSILEGFTHKEIGEKLKISEGTSKSQLARARYVLQKLINKNNEVACC